MPVTIVAVVLKQLRESKHLTKHELAKRAGIHPSLVSRLESGLYSARPATLRKLEVALSVADGTLTEHQQHDTVRLVKLAFPHALPSAALIMLAIGGEQNDLELASYGKRGSGDLEWIKPRSRRVELKIDPPDRSETLALVGTGLKNLLDERRADIVVIWKTLIEAWPEIYTSVAQIAWGLSGCVVQAFPLKELNLIPARTQGTDITDQQFDWDVFYRRLESRSFLVLYPEGVTQFVHQYEIEARLPIGGISFERRQVDFGDWPTVLKTVGDSKADCVLFFGWEPYINWLGKAVLRDCTPAKWLGLYLANKTEIPVYSTLDLVVRNDNEWAAKWLAQQRSRQGGFFTRLVGYIREIENALAEPSRQRSATLNTVARYLDLQDEQQLADKLRQFDFGLRYYA